jgi:phosphatidate cytidylyltransferase
MLRRGSRSAPELYGRTITFWWMLAGFLVAVATPRVCAFLLMGGLVALAMREYLSLLPDWGPTRGERGGAGLRATAYGACGLAVWTAYLDSPTWFFLVVPSVAISVLPLLFVLADRTAGTVAQLGFLAVGVLFFAFNFGHGLLLLNMGVMTLVYCFVLTEMRDLISYWVGKGLAAAYRRKPGNAPLRWLNVKIAPTVSPNKAWGAGLISVALTALLAAAMAPALPEFPRGRIDPLYAAGIGVVLGLLGMLGDLVFSMWKRDIGVKDSGSALPGGTGVIDRIDSLVFTLPALYHLLYWRYFTA